MEDNSEPALSKKKRYCVKFNDSLRNLRQVKVLLYVLCRSDYSVAYGGENDINKHKDSSRHKGYVDTAQRQKKLTDFGASSATANLDQKVVKAKLLFSGFLVEHELPLTTADHAAKLFRNMFPDTKIVNKYRCSRTKTTHMLAGPVSKQITSDLKDELLLTPWYRLATDGSSDEDDKHLPVSVRHVDKDSGLIVTSLLDIPNINSGSTAQQMYDVCNEVKEALSLDRVNCVTCTSGIKNSVIGQCNCLLQKIRSALVALVI